LVFGVDVVELKTFDRFAADAAAAEHLDQLRAPSMLACPDVLPHIGGTRLGHLTNRK
jgi:hypothetical protein